MSTGKAAKNSDKSEPLKSSVVKPVKKLIVVDGNDEPKPVLTPPNATVKKIAIVAHDDAEQVQPTTGDTPAVTDAEELSSLSQAIDETAIIEAVKAPVVESSDPKLPTTPQDSDKTTVEPGPPLVDTSSTALTVGDAIAAAQTKTDAEGPVGTLDDLDMSHETTSASDSPKPEAAPEEADQETLDQAEPVAVDKEFSDEKTARVVDQIVAAESDELLEREDAERTAINAQSQKKQLKIGALIKNWWINPAIKWGTIVGLLLVVLLVTMLPASRYAILNAVGVKAKASLTVYSSDSQQPLKNAEVSIANQSKSTDDDGFVSFSNLALGKQQMKIKKSGYATIEQSKVLGWGSNPLGKMVMTVTGTKFSFVAKDFLSGKAVASAEAISGEYNATADNDGKIVLAINQTDDKNFTVTIKAPEYRDEVIVIKPTDTGERVVQMVPSKQHVFVSKRTGKYDIYKIDADGKNESVLVPATGSEREDISLLTHPTRQYTALVSTREVKRNKDGYLLSSIYVVNVQNGEMQKIGQSERIQLIDWSGDRIVYIAIVDGASAANPARSKLYSFEIGQPGAKELASANYFNDAVVFKSAVYYAPSSYALPVASAKFYKTNPDGTNTSTIFDKEVWSILRNDYDTLYLSVQQDWYELKQNGTPTKLGGAPTNLRSKVYRDNFDKSQALWTDQRDGKGVLLTYNINSKKDDVLETRAGLTQPASWLSNTTYIFRVSDSREVADYVKSTAGGDAKKLRDVTNTDMSYYYN